MNIISKLLLIISIFSIPLSACSQNGQSKKDTTADSYVGSTPCNPMVNALLQIAATDTCAYMKWQLSIIDKNKSTAAFKLLISYGDYQPNTLFFLGGGKSLTFTGKLTTSTVIKNGSTYKIYHLPIFKGKSELLLIEMDNNILHLIDRNSKLIKGDPGHGFVLNRSAQLY